MARPVLTSYQVWNRKTAALEAVPVFNAARLGFYHTHPVGRLLLTHLLSTRLFNRLWMARMFKPESKSRIPEFIRTYGINVDEVLEPLDSFQTFNDFFIRRLKPGARPIDERPEALISPCDGQLVVCDELRPEDTFEVKGRAFSVRTFLQDDALAAAFQGGAVCNVYLAPYDYHRFHYPVSGTLVSRRRLGNRLFAVNPELSIANGFRPYDVNLRQINVLESPALGKVAIVEVGAYAVGGIVDTDGADFGPRNKGQEKGYFEYGGSTVVVLFQKGAVRFDRDLTEQSARQVASRVKMGERIGTLRA